MDEPSHLSNQYTFPLQPSLFCYALSRFFEPRRFVSNECKSLCLFFSSLWFFVTFCHCCLHVIFTVDCFFGGLVPYLSSRSQFSMYLQRVSSKIVKRVERPTEEDWKSIQHYLAQNPQLEQINKKDKNIKLLIRYVGIPPELRATVRILLSLTLLFSLSISLSHTLSLLHSHFLFLVLKWIESLGLAVAYNSAAATTRQFISIH